MKNKSLLILFIFSFLCVVFTVNNICCKYFDNVVNTKIFISQNILNNDIISTDLGKYSITFPHENGKLLVSFCIAILFLLLFSFANYNYLILFLLSFILAYYIAFKLLLNNGIVLSVVSPIFLIFFAKFFANTYISVFKDNISKKFENILSKYVSKNIKNKILKNNNEVTLGGKRSEITVMFADIRGFTSFSETRKAEEVSALLNEYFSLLEPIIAKYNGVINKFIGDAVLVVFGDSESVSDKNHAQNAVKCACEMKNKVKALRDEWIKNGKPKIDIGIGINTGDAFIGNVGSANRFEYTVIGDTVNIASRIEDYNKIYKTNLLISQNTYNKISQMVDVIKISEVSIKGKRKKINIYEVLRITE